MVLVEDTRAKQIPGGNDNQKDNGKTEADPSLRSG
jgi:hypothetical protein